MHSLNRVYYEKKKGKDGYSYIVSAYTDEDRNVLYGIPPIIHLARMFDEEIVEKRWTFHESLFWDAEVVRKAIRLFDQFVAENEIRSKEA